MILYPTASNSITSLRILPYYHIYHKYAFHRELTKVWQSYTLIKFKLDQSGIDKKPQKKTIEMYGKSFNTRDHDAHVIWQVKNI